MQVIIFALGQIIILLLKNCFYWKILLPSVLQSPGSLYLSKMYSNNLDLLLIITGTGFVA